MSQLRVDGRPQFWIVAGPNGAGKSTVGSLAHGVPDVLDPDAICRSIRNRMSVARLMLSRSAFHALTNWLAVEYVENAVWMALRRRRTVAIETVLSSSKYLKHVVAAGKAGFEVNMVFVALPDPEDHVRRVEQRRLAGLHDVPIEKIRARWYRSHETLGRFLPHLDYLAVISNIRFRDDDIPDPVLVAEKETRGAEIQIFLPDELPEVTRQLRAASRNRD